MMDGPEKKTKKTWTLTQESGVRVPGANNRRLNVRISTFTGTKVSPSSLSIFESLEASGFFDLDCDWLPNTHF